MGTALAQQTAVVPSVTGGTGIVGGTTNAGLTTGAGLSQTGIGGGLAGSPFANSTTAQAAAAANAPPSISGYSLADISGLANTRLSPSNILAPFYANPLYAGRAGTNGSTIAPGGFGVALYGNPVVTTSTLGAGTGTGSLGLGGAAGTTNSLFTGGGRTTGFGGAVGGVGGVGGLGRTGGFGAQGGFGQGGFGQGGFGQGGFGQTGFGQTGQINAVVTQAPRPIAYSATLKFAAPVTTAPVMQAELRNIISSSDRISNPANVQIITDGRTVVLRGIVADRDEAKLIEGMIRLTPGVRTIRNELQYPGAP